ncbi:5-oxoprolinase subunit B family protein [Rhodococcus chondri]|uniref:Allophanate hydrolase subunit 1 n=1 Tax=Rhodococcus chondri TaxID=3065941 RepID=A0ABU7JN02_9NOCA|nr:allophanate hydrolase subunit 1 [Rhodococcus sp. CC-R104]MEE2031418.1 allophanate hydrolase subunit 1 [Rhodococcus sp. CC-R104]
MRLLRSGDAAVLAEFDSLREVLACFRGLDAARPHGIVDLVPAARTLLVRFDPMVTTADAVRRWVDSTAPVPPDPGEDRQRVVGVRYDGPDLVEVGELTGLGVDGVVEAHTSGIWTVAFGGFAPGFAYLAGSDERLHVPRRGSPRTAVPAGAVGLAGEFSGVYPRRSPGGWQLIGTTTEVLWQPDRTPPALLRPGMTVRFEAV